MPARRALMLLVACLAGPACNTEYENPFDRTTTVAPPTRAAIIFTSNSYTIRSGAPRDIFAVESTGAGLTRLTFCNTDAPRCDSVEAAPAPQRQRMAVRRVLSDTDGDGRLSPADGEGLFFLDLERGTEAQLVHPSARASGVDWSALGDSVLYSAVGEGGREDLWLMEPNGQNNRNLTRSPGTHERRPRFNPAGNGAVFERIGPNGKGQIVIFSSFMVTSGGPGSEALPNTPYVVGSDADPDYSPDGRSLVFRRLTALGNGGLGSWDILTVRADGSRLTTLATGPAFRGAPDWGPSGIVFSEVDTAAGTSQLVVMQPDGSDRQTPVTLGASAEISFPRWLP